MATGANEELDRGWIDGQPIPGSDGREQLTFQTEPVSFVKLPEGLDVQPL